jgi:hypothetical protein
MLAKQEKLRLSDCLKRGGGGIPGKSSLTFQINKQRNFIA